jgi:hypothetical protein
MDIDLNVPYVYLDFPNQDLYIAGFFQAGSNSLYNTPTATPKPIPNQRNNNYLDVQITVQISNNPNNFDGAMIDISAFMDCVFALVTQTNADGTLTKAKIHIEAASPDILLS